MKNLIILTAAALLLMTPAIASANLLTNGDFEGSAGASWVNWGHANFTRDFDATDNKHGGAESYKVSWTTSVPEWNSAIALQEYIPISGGQTAYADLWVDVTSALNNAEAYLEVIFYNGVGTETGKQAGTKFGSFTGGWTQDSFSYVAPSGTTNAKYQLVVLPLPGGSASGTVYFDDAYFDTQAIPEPTSLFLLGSGLIGLLGFAKKKK